MIYLEYERFRVKYADAQRMVDEILEEKEKLFQRTQPKSTMGEYEREFDKAIRVGGSGGTKVNQVEEYVIELEERQINERLTEAKAILEDRAALLQQKEQELRASKHIDDELYCLRYLDRMRVRKISQMMNYSEPQIYRRLKIIRDKINDDRK
jgi:hypothetical protein